MGVLDVAMKMERTGRDFFHRLVQKTERDGLKTIYRRMAEDEEVLCRRMEELRSRQGDADASSLERINEVFTRMLNEREALAKEDDLEAYGYLLQLERDVVGLYREAAERESDGEARQVLQQVIAAEEKELRELESTYDFINAPNEFLAWREFSNLDEFHNFGRYEDNRRCRHTS